MIVLVTFHISCAATGQVSKKTVDDFINDSVIRTGHAGISIYDPAEKKFLYTYNAEKNFIPSSNVKLFTLYAGMKYLGDSILTAKILDRNDTLFFQPTGDPTFLHKDFADQPFLRLLSGRKNILFNVSVNDHVEKYGAGWSWDDYMEDFMPERSRFPVYGNVFSFKKNADRILSYPAVALQRYFDETGLQLKTLKNNFKIARDIDKNTYRFIQSKETFQSQDIPFITDNVLYKMQADLLSGTINADVKLNAGDLSFQNNFYSRPVDSMFQPMMYNSDNFFAEQTLLMVSDRRLGSMNDAAIIDSLLKTDLKDIPQQPRWVDGCGLSRYNLFSPNDFIFILDKLKTDFGIDRMMRILPSGGKGTLTNFYGTSQQKIFAKTGSMSNNVSLSGYLLTKKDKLLYFSVLINNFTGSGRSVRRTIESFISRVRETN